MDKFSNGAAGLARLVVGRKTEKTLKAVRGSDSCESSVFKVWQNIEQTESLRAQLIIEQGDDLSEEEREKVVTLSGGSIERTSFDKKTLRLVYGEALNAIINRIGSIDGRGKVIEKSSLYEHLQDAFDVSTTDHKRWLQAHEAMEKPDKFLQVKVISAENLAPADENGLSDPFVILGVVRLSAEQEAQRRRNEELPSVEKISSEATCTNVREKTLNPVWNEDFRLKVNEVGANDYLQMDVWDCDGEETFRDAMKKLVNAKGIKGVGRWVHKKFEDKKQFLGRLYVPLKRISEKGADIVCPLENKRHKVKSRGSQLHIMLRFSAKQRVMPLDPNYHVQSVYKALYWELACHDIRQRQDWNFLSWDGEISALSQSILTQHALQHQLSPLQTTILDLSVLVKYHSTQYLDCGRVLAAIMKGISKTWQEEPKEVSQLDDGEVNMLADSLLEFKSRCLRMLQQLREFFPSKKKAAMQQLRGMLVALQTTYDSPIFWERYPDQNLVDDVVSVIKSATTAWFKLKLAIHEPKEWCAGAAVKQLVDLVRLVVDDLMVATQVYNIHFDIVKVDYFVTVFMEFDQLLSASIEQTMQHILPCLREIKTRPDEAECLSSETFVLFMAVQQLEKYYSMIDERERQQMRFSSFYDFFKPVVDLWLHVAEVKAVQMVTRAVEIDKAVRVSNTLPYSTSAVDVSTTVSQIVTFWKQLSWPCVVQRFVFATSLMESIMSVVRHYGQYTRNKLKRISNFDNGGQFSKTEELCVTLNSLDHIKQCVENIPSKLGWQDMAKSLEKVQCNGKETAMSLSKRMVEGFVEDMENISVMIIKQISVRMKDDINCKIVAFLETAKSEMPIDHAMENLMTYLTSNMQTLYQELLPETFHMILHELWIQVVTIYSHAALGDSKFKRNLLKTVGWTYFQRLKELLKILETFFVSDGHGLTEHELECPQHQLLRDHLDMNSMATTDLFCEYLNQVVKLQEEVNMGKHEFGTVTVSAVYDSATEKLEITVLHAKDLLAVDCGDTSDPYFELFLEPVELFPDSGKKKTRVEKKTVTPLYDQTFTFTMPAELQKRPGCVVVLHCKDWNPIIQDVFLGESMLPVNTVSMVTGTDVKLLSSSLHEQKRFTLPLKRPVRAPKGAFSTIAARSDYDPVAAKMIQRRKKLFKQIDQRK